MKLRISTEEENFDTIILDLRACGHTGLADSIQQAVVSVKATLAKREEAKRSESKVNPWD